MTALLRPPAALLAGTALVSVAAVGVALVSQHVFGMEPCPWCILQRVIFLAIALVCLVGLVCQGALAGAPGAAAGAGRRGVGPVAALQAAASASCAMTLADQIVIA